MNTEQLIKDLNDKIAECAERESEFKRAKDYRWMMFWRGRKNSYEDILHELKGVE